MKKTKNKIISIILAITVVFSFQVVAFAANTWSDPGTIVLNHDTGWKRKTTTNGFITNVKTTDSGDVTVYTVSKTMASNPQFRMVNSDNSPRSSSFAMPSAGRQKTSASNTGEKGFKYYASVKAAWNQTSDNQSIKLQFKSH